MSTVSEDIHVLFVDDDPLQLRAVARALSGSVSVSTANGAREAMDVLSRSRIDVVISDLDMPEVDGVELLAFIRREHPNALRMMLTAAPSLDRALRAINEGEVHRFFVKPLDIAFFARTVKSLGERLARLRRQAERDSREARRDAFFAWIDAHGPAPALARDPRGEVFVDLSFLEAALRASGAEDALSLLALGPASE
ncbi:MAG: response regulator [Deltaproteobacteria bacterium]|nr:response regulator [Deltaproteobacteria bacterium]